MDPSPAKRLKGKTNVKSKNGGWKVCDVTEVNFNDKYGSEEFRQAAALAWASDGKEPIELAVKTSAVVYKNPFSCCQLKNFFQDDDFLYKLKDELLSLSFSEKSNDLYKFKQSQDLKKVNTSAISAVKKFIYSPDFRHWLEEVTGIELDSTVDMSCAKYNHTGTTSTISNVYSNHLIKNQFCF